MTAHRAILFLCLSAGLLLPAVATASRPEIWIAARRDGRAGRGTAADPLDGSTAQKLDVILRRALDTENMRVHFGPGRFYTRSALAQDPVYIRKPGVSVIGAGMYRTTLALDPSVGPILPPWAFSVLHTDQHIVEDSHLTVQDMTFDANYQNLIKPRRDIAIGSVNLTGSNCSLIRVRGINAYGDDASGKECFALNIGCGGPYDIHDALIADCVVQSPRGNYVNGITLLGWTFDVYPATNASGIVRGCKVSNLRSDGHHMAAYGLASGTLTDCEAENCTIGVYLEYARDLTITNCTFRGITWRGVWAFPANNYGGIQNLKVLNCSIQVSSQLKGAAAIEVASGTEKNATSGALLSGNTLLRKKTRASQEVYAITSSPGVRRLLVIGNQIDRRLSNDQVRSASWVNNRSLTGAALRAPPDMLIRQNGVYLLQPNEKPPMHKRRNRMPPTIPVR